MQQTILIRVAGKVQGVFFRQSTREKAIELGLTGYVCNLADGTVQLIATGTEEKLSLLKAWCRQGPPKAVVTAVEAEPVPFQAFEKFTIERS